MNEENKVDQIIAKYCQEDGMILSILEEVQQSHENKYLPQATLEYLAKKIRVPLSQIYSVVTFYSFFNLRPQGKHCVQVCRGTACHSQGSKNILDSLKNLLAVKDAISSEEEKVFITTPDNKFTIRTVACFGQCALAPVVVVDETIYANVTGEKLKKILKKYR